MVIVHDIPEVEATETVRILLPGQMEDCREAWQTLQRHPNAEWDFYHLINRSRQTIESGRALELRALDTTSLWAARIERTAVPISFGYLRLGGIEMRSLNVITGGVMGDTSDSSCRLLLQEALRLVEQEKLDALVLSFLPCDGTLFKLVSDHVLSGYLRDWSITPTIHWTMQLPESFDELLAKRSRKHRYWLKRLSRTLHDSFPGQVQIRAFTAESEVAEFCRDAAAVSKITYQYQVGEAFVDDQEHQERCRLLAAAGALRGYILYIEGGPRAYWMGTICRDTLYLNSTGYDPALKRLELGTVLLLKLFEDHCGTEIKKIDFGHGDAPYKQRFGDESFWEASVVIARRIPRNLVIRLLTAFNMKLDWAVKNVATKLGVLQWLKTAWRRRLSRKAGDVA